MPAEFFLGNLEAFLLYLGTGPTLSGNCCQTQLCLSVLREATGVCMVGVSKVRSDGTFLEAMRDSKKSLGPRSPSLSEILRMQR